MYETFTFQIGKLVMQLTNCNDSGKKMFHLICAIINFQIKILTGFHY